jgi:long-chain acyl-CoA synthetase
MTLARPWLQHHPRAEDGVTPRPFSPRFSDGLALFRHNLSADAQAPAVHYFDRTLSYRELDDLSEAFAAWLLDQGVGAGERVALYLQNVPQFAICLLGAWKVGAIGVSINPMNRSRELTLLLADSGARVLVSHRDLFEDTAREVLQGFPQVLAVTTSVRDFQTRNDPRLFTGADLPPCYGSTDLCSALALLRGRRVAPVQAAPASPAVLVYTSGTTGVPKGAVVSHANFAADAEIYRCWTGLRGGAPVLAIAPLFHITGLIGHIGLAWAIRAPMILAMRFHPAVVAEAAEQHRAEFVVGAITAFIALMNAPEVTPRQFASLTLVLSGGAPVPAQVAAEFERHVGVPIHNCYGMTESTSLAVSTPPGQRGPVDAQGALSVGVPVFATDVRIVDDAGADVPAGTVGEILLRGPQVVAGYWQRPAETAETFIDGWLRSGDVGYLDAQGWLFLVDRKKDMIVASGYKVWPKEVEDVLYTHPAVREAAVVGVIDAYRGETVKAVISLKPGQHADAESLIDFCKARMAAYKYPRIVDIVDELPKTATGKILRRSLR